MHHVNSELLATRPGRHVLRKTGLGSIEESLHRGCQLVLFPSHNRLEIMRRLGHQQAHHHLNRFRLLPTLHGDALYLATETFQLSRGVRDRLLNHLRYRGEGPFRKQPNL